MMKILKLVNVQLNQTGGVNLCLTDYRPEVEDVDPRKEKLKQLKGQLPAEYVGMFEGLMELSDLPSTLLGSIGGHSRGHEETATILLTAREYEEMGRPSVGQLLSFHIEGEPYQPGLVRDPPGMKGTLAYLIDTVKKLEGPERKPIGLERLKQALAEGLRSSSAESLESLIQSGFREGLLYESKPGFIKRVGK